MKKGQSPRGSLVGEVRVGKRGKMTDEEMRCAVLKYVYDEKKAGKEIVLDVAERVSTDYKIDIERVFSVLRGMEKEGLVENVPFRSSANMGMASANNTVITERGLNEYKEKCKHGGG